jgi:tRNA A37 methylthiotransferase MiaB
MKLPLKIYLADLTYDTVVLQTAVFPLNIGYIASYCKKRFGSKVDITLFKYIDELDRAINESPPDILGMSNYVWNHRVSLEMFRMISKKNPYALKIWGGPNFPMDLRDQKKFLNEFSEVDVYVPLEGEVGFSNCVEKALQADSKEQIREKVLSSQIDNCLFLGLDGKLQYNFTENRIKNLDEIPSPYTMGLMDKFFDDRLSPMLQTNRGCPFKCTFCVDGGDGVNVINSFSLERVYSDIDYIMKHVSKKMHDMEISDLNFGMYPRDIKICQHIAERKKTYDFPHNIHVTTGKNNKERIIKAIECLSSSIRLCMSVQSLDTEVLKNIRRANISVDEMMGLAPAIRNSGLEATSEVILGLPGETFEAHLRTLQSLLSAKMDHLMVYSCMLLKGSQMDLPEQRKKWDLKTKFRILVKDFAKLSNGKKVIEIEEIVIGSNTMTFEDYINLRSIDFAIYASNTIPTFRPLLKFLREHEIDLLELFHRIVKQSVDNPSINKIFKEFRQLTTNELWDTPEELEAHYQNESEYQKLLDGKSAFNILYYCTGQVIGEYIDEWLDYIINVAKKLLIEENKFDNKLQEQFLMITNFCRGLSYNILGKDRVDTNPEFIFNYDVQKWLDNTTNLPLSYFKTPSCKIMFCLTNEQYKLVQENLIENGRVIFSWFKPRKKFKGYVELLQIFWRHPIIIHDKKIIRKNT